MSPDVEQVRQSYGSKDGAKSVKRDETTPTSSNEYQGRSISSQLAAVNATAKTKYEAIRHQLDSQNQAATGTTEEKKFFDPDGKEDFCALPSRPIPLSGRA